MDALNLVYGVGNGFDGFIHVADTGGGNLDGCVGFVADMFHFFGNILNGSFKFFTGGSHALDGTCLCHYLLNHFYDAGIVADVLHGLVHTHNVVVVGLFEDSHHFVEFFCYFRIGINRSVNVGILAVDELLHCF